MGRSHAWLRRGQELIEPRPMNWGDNLTLVGAIRVDRWLTLATTWGALDRRDSSRGSADRARCLRPGDIVVLDDLTAHKSAGPRSD